MKTVTKEKLNSNERLTEGFRDYRKRMNIERELPLITLFSKALANKTLISSICNCIISEPPGSGVISSIMFRNDNICAIK